MKLKDIILSAAIVLMAIFWVWHHSCQSRILLKTQKNLKEAEKIIESKEKNEQEFDKKYESVKTDLDNALKENENLKKKDNQIIVKSKKEIRKLRSSNRTWAEKYEIVEDQYYKALDKLEIKDLRIENLEVAIQRAKYKIDDMYVAKTKLVSNFDKMKKLFENQVELTERAVRNSTLYKIAAVVAGVGFLGAAVF